jgi:hypothetical protein
MIVYQVVARPNKSVEKVEPGVELASL